MYKIIRPAFTWFQHLNRSRAAFQRPHSSCADRAYFAVFFFCLIHDAGSQIVDLIKLSVHFVLLQVFDFEWPEGAEAGMQGHFCETDPLDLTPFDEFFTEVKTSGG